MLIGRSTGVVFRAISDLAITSVLVRAGRPRGPAEQRARKSTEDDRAFAVSAFKENGRMAVSAIPTSLDAIMPFREAYREEMDCQIVHDSIHARPGWSNEYLLRIDGAPAGYGSVAVAGPWAGKRIVYEFYVGPAHRGHVFDLFAALLQVGNAGAIEVQSNDPLAAAM